MSVQPAIEDAASATDVARLSTVALASPTQIRVSDVRSPRRAVSSWGHFMLDLPRTTWTVVDVAILTAGIWLGYRLFALPHSVPYAHVTLWQAWLIFSLSLTVSSLVFGLYERETLLVRSRIVTRTALTSALAVALAYAAIYVVMYTTVSRRVTGVALGGYLLLGTSIRLLACWALQRVKRGVLVVGPGRLIEALARAGREGLLPHYRLVGSVDDGPSDIDETVPIPRLGRPAEIPSICRQRGVHDIVVGSAAARDPQVLAWLLPCLRMGCRVTNEAVFYEKNTGQILVDQITPQWFLFADLKTHCEEVATFKRVMDTVVSAAGLLLALPLLPLIALAIRLDDGGPVFYWQDRVGQNGVVFRLYKFRTMRVNAETGPSVWALRNDPRTTRVGRFLRRTRLDELPQLYNVLCGQMSLVGLRPERPDIVETLIREIPYYAERHLVKPGITGWAQISFRYGNSVEDARRKLQFDLYYLKHMSFELDLIILFRTVGTFLRGAC